MDPLLTTLGLLAATVIGFAAWSPAHPGPRRRARMGILPERQE